MFTLYNNEYSTCSQKVRLVLAEKNLAWTDVQLSFAKGEHLSPEYLEINPSGVVPTLVHDEWIIPDSSVIMEYLDEVAPQPAMSSSTPQGRAELRAWLRYFEEVATPAVRYPSFNQAFVRRFAAMSSDEFTCQVNARPLRKRFYERMGQSGFDERELGIALENIAQTCKRMEGALRENDWLLGGDRPSIADCCVAPLIDRMADLGHAYLWSDAPGVAAWLARFRERNSWNATFYEGARMSDRFDDLLSTRRTLPELVSC
ncbi:glutathione S-transferase family protein [Variovorax paradoxus]|nr:glutathione S-transferase family protein [Variovorax paradoxus]MBT2305104.1 glutathione S-transferase family protein [Variovorax paradoxus]